MKPSDKNLPVTFRFPRKGQVLIGSWITIPHPAIAEIMAKAGFEWLTVDMEHSPIGVSAAEEMIRVIRLCGLPVLVRVGENSPLLIKRAMDSGASGVIVPMISTAQEARAAVEAVKYPPLGQRGVGLARAQGYGTLFQEYYRWVAEESIVIVQIEHIQAVKNLDAILAVEHVDGCMIGPYDLSASLGVPGQFDHPDMIKALNMIKKAIQRKAKPFGFHVVHPDVQTALSKFQQGYSFLAFGVDFLFVGEMCRENLKELKRKIEKDL